MNCREIQSRLHAAPRSDRDDLQAHLATCATCRLIAAEVARLDREIGSAALAVHVPEGLSARVLLRQQEAS